MTKKKKENELSYLGMPLPSGSKAYKAAKRSWSGANFRQTIDTGQLSKEMNIQTAEAPYLTPSPRMIEKWWTDTELEDINVIGLFGFDDFLLVIYRESTQIKAAYVKDNNSYAGILKSDAKTDGSDDYPRCVVQFNVYDKQTDPLTGKYDKKLLIFPDKKSMDFEITKDNFEIADMSVLVKEFNPTGDKNTPPDTASHSYYYRNCKTSDIYKWVDDESDSDNSGWKISIPPAVPNIKYATVHLSRLFGVDNDRVYASGFNDYTNWNLDTVDEYNESNAWCSPSQSNTKAGGSFTGITTFQNHVVCFKPDFMHEIYNTKNPFRIQDIYAEGTIDNRTIQDVDGRLIFVSDDGVKLYTGSNPRNIGYYLGIDRFTNPVSGTDGRNYYLYCEDESGSKRLLVYDTFVEQWSERELPKAYDEEDEAWKHTEVLNFAHNKKGMYMLCGDGNVYKLDTKIYDDLENGDNLHKWSFETDLITNETVDIKHIKKLQLFADIKKNANIRVYILYDDEEYSDSSQLVYDSKEGIGQKAIRVKPRKTANYGFKLHFEGKGYVRLYEVEIVMQAGGDLYV